MDTQFAESLDRQLTANQLHDAERSFAANAGSVRDNCSDAVATIMRHLNDTNFTDWPDRFHTCERLLIGVAETANVEEALLELVEVVETTHSDNVFTSTLKALQVCLRRQSKHKVRAFKWCLNSVWCYMANLPVPACVRDNADGDAAAQLFEDNDQVRRLLTNYMTLFLFIEPLLADIAEEQRTAGALPAPVFQGKQLTRTDMTALFLLHMLCKPFVLLNWQRPEEGAISSTNTYSWQCASTIVRHLLQLLPDPVFLLVQQERLQRWPGHMVAMSGLSDKEAASAEEVLTLCVAALFYLLYVERLMPASVPQIYTDLYLFEGILYLLTPMLTTNMHELHAKALRLADVMLRRCAEPLPAATLGLRVHEQFCVQLCRVITQSPCRQNSQHGAQILRQYVMRFDGEGRVAVVRNLLRTVEHGGLLAHIANMYKDMVAEALRQHDVKRLPEELCGRTFRALLLRHICRLDGGAETDLLQNSDQLVVGLNVLYFLALGDRSNRTGFWDVVAEVKAGFLEPLRKALELTRSHYGLEHRRVLAGEDVMSKSGVELSLPGEDGEVGSGGPVDRDAKLKLLRSAQTTFDLMESLLASVEHALRSLPKM